MGKSKYLVTRLISMPCEKEHDQKVLDISDGRQAYKSIRDPFQRNESGEYIRDGIGSQVYLHPLLNPQMHIPHLWEKEINTVVGINTNGKELRVRDYWQITQIDDIHSTFFEQLTMQISPLIFQKLGKTLPKTYCLSVFEDFIIEEKAISYMLIYLVKPLRSDLLWIKWASKSPKKTYIKINEPVDFSFIRFDLCSLEEEKHCSRIRFEGKHNEQGVGTIETLREYIEKQKPKLPKLRFKYSLHCDNYPDVIYQLFMESEITKELKLYSEGIFQEFVAQWNENQPKDERIHDAFLYENKTDRSHISIAVDFGNTNSQVVLELLQYIHNSDLKIKNIIVS